ncbi:hypothetical protein AAFF_G00158790 [Aldrovandia affinis]|uniref:Uncharacterized protein n=1 Tax=Aldrovandia affinis TaxID=143900 RepID=A0AAD7RMY7_9TELE|nr:hypothetical protein AAFF_G00158790 [Aldrovandia affinis]
MQESGCRGGRRKNVTASGGSGDAEGVAGSNPKRDPWNRALEGEHDSARFTAWAVESELCSRAKSVLITCPLSHDAGCGCLL